MTKYRVYANGILVGACELPKRHVNKHRARWVKAGVVLVEVSGGAK